MFAGCDVSDITIKVKRELFRFSSEQDWINKGKSRYANCGVRQGHYIAIDAMGRVMHMGKCFKSATEQGAYPVVVYELETNWEGTNRRPLPLRLELEAAVVGAQLDGQSFEQGEPA